MQLVRSLVFLSLTAGALSAPPAAPGELNPSAAEVAPLPQSILAESTDAGANHTRDKKSTSGTCVTVNEPHKPPFTFCNNGASVAGAGLALGGGGASLFHHQSGGGGAAASPAHAGGEAASSHGSGLAIGGAGAGLHSVGHGAAPLHHVGGSGVPAHPLNGFASPQIAVHPSLHPDRLPHSGASGALNGGSNWPGAGAGFSYGEILPFGYPSNQGYNVLPAYDQFSYGDVQFPQFRATDFTEDEAMAMAAAAAQRHAQAEVAGQRMRPQSELMRLTEARAQEAARQAQLQRELEWSARSAPAGPSFAPWPAIDNYLPTMPAPTGQQYRGAGVGVFPRLPAGGGCGAIPLLLSCSPTLVRGSLAHGYGSGAHGAGYASGYQQTPWAYGGGVYRQNEESTASSKANKRENKGKAKDDALEESSSPTVRTSGSAPAPPEDTDEARTSAPAARSVWRTIQ